MAGKSIPLVLAPRYTTFVGEGEFSTAGMEVAAFESARVNVWRAALLGTSPTISVTFQESTDQESWTTCDGGSAFDPGALTEVAKDLVLTKRYFRLLVTLAGTDPAVSCFAYGYLYARQH